MQKILQIRKVIKNKFIYRKYLYKFLYRCLTIILSFITTVALYENFSDRNFSLVQKTLAQEILAKEIQVTVQSDNNLKALDGKDLFRLGRFTEAARFWENELAIMQGEKNNSRKGLILSYLSLTYQELGDIDRSLETMSQALEILKESGNKSVWAKVLNNQGQLLLNQGKLETALETWERAEKIYQELGDRTGEIGTTVNQSLALQGLGMYRRARNKLLSLNEFIEQESDLQLQLVQLINLGNVLRLTGDFIDAKTVLNNALGIAQSLKSNNRIEQVLFHLGNLAFSQQDFSNAVVYYEKVAGINSNITSSNTSNNLTNNLTNQNIRLSSQAHLVEALIELNKDSKAEKLLLQLQTNLELQPLSQNKIYTQIQMGKSFAKLGKIRESSQVFAIALREAEKLGNLRAESYALGYLGNLYEQTQQWEHAKKLTRKAIKLSNAIAAEEITYNWEWQMGRLSKAMGDVSDAIDHYSNSLEILESSLRRDLRIVSTDIQFSFRDNVEPIYRQFVDLLLREGQNVALGNKSQKQDIKQEDIKQKNIIKARKTIESLRIAEIENFFRQACLDDLQRNIETIDTQAAVIYPIILKDLTGNQGSRIEVVLSLPGQPLEHYTTNFKEGEAETAFFQMRQSLRRTSFESERLAIARKIYGWLIEPAIPKLKANKIETLVFVLNGSLSNIPVAALYDGNQYLIENYQIAIAPSLKLFNPTPLERKRLSILLAGLTQESEQFSALPGVKEEIIQIGKLVTQLYPRRTQTFLDADFTTQNLKSKVLKKPFSIIHLATHGRFSSDPDKNFILTSNGKLNIDILDNLLTQRQLPDSPPIELLVLSACQTAQGDDRATLGLAGVAIRSGARSTLASLWTVNDESTAQFMIKFYQELLNSGVTKAEAVRQAQIHLLKQSKYKHPYFWAPFILVGSWL